MHHQPSEPVPVSLVVSVAAKLQAVAPSAVTESLGVQLQQLGYPADAVEVTLPDALALLERLDGTRSAGPRGEVASA